MELAKNKVREACNNYWTNKDIKGFLDNYENSDIPVMGLYEPDWEEDYEITKDYYNCHKQTDDIVLVSGKIYLQNKEDAFKAHVSVLCKCKDDNIEFTGIHMSREHIYRESDEAQYMEDTFFHKVVENLCDVAFEFNTCKNIFTYDREKYKQLFGEDSDFKDAEQWFWHLCKECIHEDDTDAVDMFRSEDIEKRLRHNDIVANRKIRIKNVEKGYIWISLTVIFIPNKYNTNLDIIIVMMRDFNDEVLMQKKTNEQASRDGLTNILNRRYTENLINKSLYKKQKGAFVIFDIDRFKSVNDTFGHITGDNVLKRIAENVLSSITEKDIFGRIGGDEFVIFLDGDRKSHDVMLERVSEILDSARFLYSEKGIDMDIHCSAGVVMVDNAGRRQYFGELYEKADKLLYEAKNSGRNMYKVYKGN